MTQLIAKYAMKKVMAKDMDKYKFKPAAGPYDPYYEEIPHPTKIGRTKKVKKEIPAYIRPQEADILAKARKTAYRLDYALFTFLGMRFGWSSVIGLIPAVGDFADAFLSVSLILHMCRVDCGLPTSVLFLMFFNLGLDFLVGLLPIIGDLADASVKCNGKNVRLLEKHLDKVFKPQAQKDAEARLPRERRPRPASVYVDFDDELHFDDDSRRPHDEEMGMPKKEVKPPVGGAKPPMKEVKPPVGAVKPPMKEVKPPVGAVKPPMKEVKPPVGAVKPPMKEVKPPVGAVKPPMKEVKPPVGAVKPPVKDDKPPVKDAKEVKPPVKDVKPPVKDAKEVKPPVKDVKDTKPPAKDAKEVKPPVKPATQECKK